MSAAQLKYFGVEWIKCEAKEDWIQQDEIKIVVNGKEIWSAFMDPGDKFDVHEGVNFTDDVTIKVIDQDSTPDGDDLLGKHTLRKNGSAILHFTRDDAHYKVKYKIHDV